MSRREYKLFIEDILESIDLIEQYTKEMDFDSFKDEFYFRLCILEISLDIKSIALCIHTITSRCP